MNNTCIFCREPKNKFTDEHVFPAAIGGGYIIKLVCDICNEKLGKNIDDPFVRHPIISYNRNVFKISRRKRNIPNPFKEDIHEDEEGNKYYSTFNEDGQLEATMKPKYEGLTKNENGLLVGKMTFPAKDFKSIEDSIANYVKRFKELGLKPSDIERVELQNNPEKSITINKLVPNKPFILGVLKIAYELATINFPNYLHDSFSKMYSKILLTGEVDEEENKYFDFDPEIIKGFIYELNAFNGIQKFHQVAILKTVQKKGFYCLVKIFDSPCAIRLSESEDYLNPNQGILILNDSIEQKYWRAELSYSYQ